MSVFESVRKSQKMLPSVVRLDGRPGKHFLTLSDTFKHIFKDWYFLKTLVQYHLAYQKNKKKFNSLSSSCFCVICHRKHIFDLATGFLKRVFMKKKEKPTLGFVSRPCQTPPRTPRTPKTPKTPKTRKNTKNGGVLKMRTIFSTFPARKPAYLVGVRKNLPKI